jgi:hypothetical protein
MPGIPRDVAEHSLDIRVGARPVKQHLRHFDEEKRRVIAEPRDSYASGIRIPHSSPSAKSNSRSNKRFCYRTSPNARNKRKENAAL